MHVTLARFMSAASPAAVIGRPATATAACIGSEMPLPLFVRAAVEAAGRPMEDAGSRARRGYCFVR